MPSWPCLACENSVTMFQFKSALAARRHPLPYATVTVFDYLLRETLCPLAHPRLVHGPIHPLPSSPSARIMTAILTSSIRANRTRPPRTPLVPLLTAVRTLPCAATRPGEVRRLQLSSEPFDSRPMTFSCPDPPKCTKGAVVPAASP